MIYFVLDNPSATPRKCTEAEFAEWRMSKIGRVIRTVGRDTCGEGVGEKKLLVSTVFVGIDRRPKPDETPLLYQTAVYELREDGEHEDEPIRVDNYRMRADALAGHAVALAWARAQKLDKGSS